MIGNGAYANLDPLKNPVNDASDIADSLRSLGFEVMSDTDLTKAGMTALIGDFLEAARTADVVALLLRRPRLPDRRRGTTSSRSTRASGAGPTSTNWTIRLDDISDELEGTPGIHLVFLDACRNNPLSSAAPVARRRSATGSPG